MRFRLIPRDEGFYPLFDRLATIAADAAVMLAGLMAKLPVPADAAGEVVAAEKEGDGVLREIRARLETAIVTTEAKAKALRPIAEKLITKAKKAQDEGPMRIHRMRQIQGYLGDKEMTHKLVTEVAPRYLDRNGGYLRILKLGPRSGDNAQMARVELV